MTTGLEAISFHIPHRYIALDTLAEQHNVDPDKFSKGIGQEKITLPGHDEDIITMAADAALPILQRTGVENIDTVLFATETGVDQSKAASIYLHSLLKLPPNCRCIELKQACYSATAALQMACSYVARKPDQKVLVIASDVARYDRDSSGEATQGAGAVAMLVSSNPKVLEVGTVSGLFTEDIMDFWRPNYRRTPLFDGKASALRYMNALLETWRDYRANGGLSYNDFQYFCFHLPFSRLGEKAHRHLAKANKTPANMDQALPGMVYNRQVGNCYTASIYLSLLSILENTQEDLTGAAIGMFSYGSGATAEFFDTKVLSGYREHLFTQRHQALLNERIAVSYEDYVALWEEADLTQGTPNEARGHFRLVGIEDDKRIYIDCRTA
ncbi:MAG: hydroxymethylglutaryl-CoA synthase [Proteobacteria bacterium]|nr:MAG: hydroxymethylglutaryl-CoA synthase [Pseudomonadota bacterium]